MGAVSSCCAVEDAEDRQIMKENKPSSREKQKTSKEKKEGSSATKKETQTKKETEIKENKDIKDNKKEEKKIKQQNSQTDLPGVSQEKVEELKKRLQGGLSICVLLQDATKLSCILHLNAADNSLSISCEDKVRVIPLSDVKCLLYTRDQLRRVETKANLVDDENCVALHLLESGNCIPIRFEDTKDKHLFVEMIKQLKSKQ